MFNNLSTILIPFDCIVDEDLGLYSVIRKHYPNNTVFILELLGDIESESYMLKNNYYDNPLKLIMYDNYIDKADLFYKEFIENEYERILDNSPLTNIYEFARKSIISKMVIINFLTFNSTQTKVINKLFDNPRVFQFESYNEIDNIKNFDIIFLKKFKDGLLIPNLKGRSLYILDYQYNLEYPKEENIEPIPDVELSIILGEHNSINIIS